MKQGLVRCPVQEIQTQEIYVYRIERVDMDNELVRLVRAISAAVDGEYTLELSYSKDATGERFEDGGGSKNNLYKTSHYISVDHTSSYPSVYLVDDKYTEGQALKTKIFVRGGYLVIESYMSGDSAVYGGGYIIINKDGMYAFVGDTNRDVSYKYLEGGDLSKFEYSHSFDKKNPKIHSRFYEIPTFRGYDSYFILNEFVKSFLSSK